MYSWTIRFRMKQSLSSIWTYACSFGVQYVQRVETDLHIWEQHDSYSYGHSLSFLASVAMNQSSRSCIVAGLINWVMERARCPSCVQCPFILIPLCFFSVYGLMSLLLWNLFLFFFCEPHGLHVVCKGLMILCLSSLFSTSGKMWLGMFTWQQT
jgi:hypothetical protein